MASHRGVVRAAGAPAPLPAAWPLRLLLLLSLLLLLLHPSSATPPPHDAQVTVSFK
jgi:hypothetical protein